MENDRITIAILLLLAVGSFVYPQIQQRRFEVRSQNIVSEFKARIEGYKQAHEQRHISLGIPLVQGVVQDLEVNSICTLYHVSRYMSFMNSRLYNEAQPGLVDPFFYDHPCFSMRFFGLDMDILGILYIPAIELTQPILMGTSFQNLHHGAAHVTHSSFPLGGENTNAVIAGYRSGIYTQVFRNVNQLDIGDEIFITNILETLAYTVVDTKMVDFGEIDALSIQHGRDLVTLVVPHFRIRKEQRYVVVAERVTAAVEGFDD